MRCHFTTEDSSETVSTSNFYWSLLALHKLSNRIMTRSWGIQMNRVSERGSGIWSKHAATLSWAFQTGVIVTHLPWAMNSAQTRIIAVVCSTRWRRSTSVLWSPTTFRVWVPTAWSYPSVSTNNWCPDTKKAPTMWIYSKMRKRNAARRRYS